MSGIEPGVGLLALAAVVRALLSAIVEFLKNHVQCGSFVAFRSIEKETVPVMPANPLIRLNSFVGVILCRIRQNPEVVQASSQVYVGPMPVCLNIKTKTPCLEIHVWVLSIKVLFLALANCIGWKTVT